MTDSAKLHRELTRIWGNLPGWGTLSAVNHTSIGLRFMVTGMVFFLIGGVLAMLLRTQLALPDQQFIGPDLYNQLFSTHALTMIFLAIMPMGVSFFNYFIPLHIGARDVAFPRMNALGYWMYLCGGLLLTSS